MKKFIQNNIYTIFMCIFMSIVIGGTFTFLGFLVSDYFNSHHHVHFIDSNECFDVKRTDVYKGSAYIYFNDGSEIKCGADNVVVFVNKVCSYCGK